MVTFYASFGFGTPFSGVVLKFLAKDEASAREALSLNTVGWSSISTSPPDYGMVVTASLPAERWSVL